jgi:hypothetical protein
VSLGELRPASRPKVFDYLLLFSKKSIHKPPRQHRIKTKPSVITAFALVLVIKNVPGDDGNSINTRIGNDVPV